MSKKKAIKTRCDTNVWLTGHQLSVLYNFYVKIGKNKSQRTEK